MTAWSGRRLRLRYSNLGGSGVSLGASHRWQENRPETALVVQWPRPLGMPLHLRLGGFRGMIAELIASHDRPSQAGREVSADAASSSNAASFAS